VIAIADGAKGPYPTAPGFYAAGAALIALGVVGVALGWQRQRAAALVSLGSSAVRLGSDRLLRGALGIALFLCLATVALLLLRSFSYRLVGAFAALAALVAAAAELIGPRRARATSAQP
jgi:hypothetical protein